MSDIDPDQLSDLDDAWTEDDEEAEVMMNCGRYAGAGGCSLAGTEWCDWDCPFSDELFRPRRPRRKDKRQPPIPGLLP